MKPNTPMRPSDSAQELVAQYYKQCYNGVQSQWNIREQLRQVDLAYIRETDWTKEHRRALIANKYGDSTKFQNVTVPVVMPQVEAAVTYLTSVFLTGTPIFGVVSNPLTEDIATQMETIIDENSTRGSWVRHLMMAFRDGFKYNLSAVEVTWDQKVTAALETDPQFNTKDGKPKQVIWEGNCIKRLDLYNTIMDIRVAPSEISEKGEFAGYTERMGRTRLKTYISELPGESVFNLREAFESGVSGGGILDSFYTPQINPDAILDITSRSSFDWFSWAGMINGTPNGIQYKNSYDVTTFYARIIPSDFGMKVPAPNTPQVWKFIIVNDCVLIYAERQTNAHNKIPILFSQPLEDGLGYQTKSFANNVRPFQDVSSALINSAMAARRRAISDRMLYDPSRVDEKQINNPNPSAKIPVRPAAYGKPLQESIYAIPFRDDQSQIAMSDMSQMLKFADITSGQNQAQQGQFVKGNKTLHEYADVMAHSNGKNQLIALGIEAQLFTPMKEIIKINILQYQGGTELYNQRTEQVVNIDPVALRKAVIDFKISDGLTPSDKLINGDDFGTAMQAIGTNPALASGYNIAPMFSYLMKTRNVDLKAFEKSQQQVAFEGATNSWQQTVMQLVKANPQITPAQFPPQPKPADYGYTPGTLNTPADDANKPTLLEQVIQAGAGTSTGANATPPSNALQGAAASATANQQPASAGAQ